ncbi:MAG: hypothetical protein WCA84_10955 [Ignavibacteriaceae bacterium]|jgi:hypothetical protein
MDKIRGAASLPRHGDGTSGDTDFTCSFLIACIEETGHFPALQKHNSN